MTQPKVHRVAPGETLSSIAKLEAVDLKALAKLNGIKNINLIRRGQILQLPPRRMRAPPHAPAATPSKKAPLDKPAKTEGYAEKVEDWTITHVKMATTWIDALLTKLRTDEANEHVQKKTNVPVPIQPTMPTGSTPAPQASAPQQTGSLTPQTLTQVKQILKATLNAEPHIIQFDGVKLSTNERKQIVATVALCEMNQAAFASMNTDQEFVGRKYGRHGIETETYSRIVHVGLSYGVIQYTQDSGSLGEVLKMMRTRNPAKFVEIFGGGDSAISDSLVTLTTVGRADLINNAEVPLSGLSYWSTIRSTPQGQEIKALANGPTQSNLPVSREVRGKRVQPLVPNAGAAPVDIWKGVWKTRFVAAGQVLDFQEVQLEAAVQNYFNGILGRAKAKKVRSALALAFIAACAIRGGVGSQLEKLFYKIAAAMDLPLPFTSSADERRCFDKIADAPLPAPPAHTTFICGVKVNRDEIRRARLLRADELGFLAEDLYDLSTY